MEGFAEAHWKRMEGLKLRKSLCVHCGNAIISIPLKESFCHFCELIGDDDSVDSSKGYKELRGMMDSRNELALSGKWDDASAVAEKIKMTAIPSVLYANGLFYLAFSDVLYKSVDYGMEGYMEGNSDNRERSIKVLSEGKTQIYKAIRLSEDRLQHGYDSAPAYLRFIAYSRLQVPDGAKAALIALESKESKESALLLYARTVHLAAYGTERAALAEVGKATESQVNAFYYLARLMIREGRTGEAIKVLARLSSLVYMPLAAETLRKAREAERKGL